MGPVDGSCRWVLSMDLVDGSCSILRLDTFCFLENSIDIAPAHMSTLLNYIWNDWIL